MLSVAIILDSSLCRCCSYLIFFVTKQFKVSFFLIFVLLAFASRTDVSTDRIMILVNVRALQCNDRDYRICESIIIRNEVDLIADNFLVITLWQFLSI